VKQAPPSSFKFRVQQIRLSAPPLKLDSTATQQGLAVVDRPRAVSEGRAVWHHLPSNQSTKAAGVRN
jgi:hypothetical protein